MAKKGISLGLTVTERDGKLFVRKAHNSGNTHNKERQDCMKRELAGKHYSNKEQQRGAFRDASRRCS